MDKVLFNHLCNVIVYHFADCAWKAGNETSESHKYLVDEGIIIDEDDCSQEILHQYNEMIEEYANEHLENHYVGWDYWGGRCFMRDREPTKNSNLPFAGETSGLFAIFTGYDALEEYTQQIADWRKTR